MLHIHRLLSVATHSEEDHANDAKPNAVGFALDDFGIERPLVAAVISNSGGFSGQNASAETYIEEGYGVISDPPYFYSEPQIFMTHATGDPTVDFQLARDIADRADAVGHPYELFTVDANTHGLPDGLFQTEYSPGVNVYQAQVNWLDSIMLGVAETPAD